jgi:type VI secretion system protein VasJ
VIVTVDERWSALANTPISEQSPVGDKADYESEWEQIRGEIDGVNGTDWEKVVTWSETILRWKSKDLRVANYLAYGLFLLKGYEGLASGLTVIRGLIVADYWDTLHPIKLRARAKSVSWMMERLRETLLVKVPTSVDQEWVKIGCGLMEEIDQLFATRLENRLPQFVEVIRIFQQMVAERVATEEREKSHSPSPRLSPQVGAPAITTAADVPKALRASKEALRNLAEFLREREPSNPQSYFLLRTGIWIEINKLPDNDHGISQIPAMQGTRLNYLNQLQQNEQWEVLIVEAEKSFCNSPFWLDGHRFVTNALESLGAEEARQAVVDALRGFLLRFPKVVDTKFSNGKGFADEITRAWIVSEVLGESTREEEAAGDEGLPWLDASMEASKFVAKGEVKEGLALFVRGKQQARNRRENFMWELEQARCYLDAGYVDVARLQLEYLDGLVERYALEEWEPELSLDIARLLLVCNDPSVQQQPLSLEKQLHKERWQARISRFDPVTAIEMSSR